MAITTRQQGGVDLSEHGIEPHGRVRRNPTTSMLYTHALERREGRLAEGGPLAVDTGRHTGRSPKDKFVVREAGSEDRIWWGDVNAELVGGAVRGAAREGHRAPRRRATSTSSTPSPGADPKHRIAVRVDHELPVPRAVRADDVHRPDRGGAARLRAAGARPARAGLEADPEADGTRSGTFVVLHPSRREILIGGTFYAGEIKKSIFTLMNDRLPLEGVFPMHCSANVGEDGDVAVFFGLSGTGKTTLSADPERHLIGDDEHGWGDDGRLQLRGRLLREGDPPERRRPSRRSTRRPAPFGTILENVVLDENGDVDLDDDSKTENTRAAYDLEQIANDAADEARRPPAVGA